MSVPPSEVQVLIDALQSMRATTYGIVAACAFLFYDVTLTMAREVRYIWRNKQWSFPKVAYISVRYYGMAYLVGGGIIFFTISNAILLLRLYSLYNRDRKILIFLLGLAAGQFATDLYAAIRITIEDVKYVIAPPLSLPWPGCFTSRFDTRFTLVSWDGTVFYLILFKTIIIAMVLSAFVQGPAALAANAWMVAMYSFATSRLLLNLREFADQSAGSVATWEQTLSIQIRPSRTDDEDYENSEIPLQWR
ncbi:hypothetical protein F5887DRAFT_1220091 [Amanita rubescens]|nr:hypothetical protein F5887DRAFT_1220091 [Amanita rubescens]